MYVQYTYVCGVRIAKQRCGNCEDLVCFFVGAFVSHMHNLIADDLLE